MPGRDHYPGTMPGGADCGKNCRCGRKEVPCGALDITRFRDDGKVLAAADRTELPFDITGRRIILVDDVVYTGRTVRAAIDAIFA